MIVKDTKYLIQIARQYLESNNITQVKAAETLGVHYSSISRGLSNDIESPAMAIRILEDIAGYIVYSRIVYDVYDPSPETNTRKHHEGVPIHTP